MALYPLPDHLLEKLKCSICLEVLSHPPIVLYAETGSVCGRCPILEDEKNTAPIREKTYEDIASILSFPCRYKPNGCFDSFRMQEIPHHEQSCQFKPYFCPILPLGTCAWQGLSTELYGHFADSHQEQLMESNNFELDIVNNYKEHYLVPAFDELFLLRVEFQNSDEMFRCCLHLVGKPDLCHKFKYQIEFKANEESFSQSQTVESDLNIFERRNECIVGLRTLQDILKEPSFIKCKIIINKVETITINDEINTEEVCHETDDEIDEIKANIKKSSSSCKFLEDIECPVCQEYMVPPIFQCMTGHSVCGNCKPQLKECPSCRTQMGNTRNFTLEKITESLEYNCRFIDDGCSFISNSKTIKQHEAECPFRPNRCPLQETLSCEWLGNINKLISHCKKVHLDSLQNGSFFETIYNPNCEKFELFKIKIENGYNFRIRYSYTKNQVACTVQCISLVEDSVKLLYEMQVIDSNNKGLLLTSRKYCGKINDNKDDLKHCTIWHLDMVKPLISEAEQKLKFKCVILKV